MESFNEENKKREIIHTKRSESFSTTEFTNYVEGDGFYSSCEQLFYPEFGGSVDYVPEQVRTLSGSFTHYQIPYETRGSGIIPSSVSITSGSVISISDDGNGNIFDANDPSETIIGNIFYNSGNIFVTNTGSFDGTAINYKDIDSEEMDFEYEREVYFIHNKYFIDIDQDEYTFSTNSTFKDSSVDAPFLTSVYLYNSKNELIAKASLSKPVSTENDIFLILDDLETV